ncbi:Hypothetical protein BROD_2162 [Brucella sp. NF 2653]|nr:predicted protein [Brucella sp. 83/13]EFM61819.1 Hypothetical protein BROD_2162 [Brucella sp. NF 2653]
MPTHGPVCGPIFFSQSSWMFLYGDKWNFHAGARQFKGFSAIYYGFHFVD